MTIFEEIDRIFDSAVWTTGNVGYIPKGYKLVEEEDHKKKRLEQSVQSTKNMIQYHEQQIKQLQDKLSQEENDLLKLNP